MLNTNCLHTATAIIAEDKVTDFSVLRTTYAKFLHILQSHKNIRLNM